jgi:hypothetical protein
MCMQERVKDHLLHGSQASQPLSKTMRHLPGASSRQIDMNVPICLPLGSIGETFNNGNDSQGGFAVKAGRSRHVLNALHK